MQLMSDVVSFEEMKAKAQASKPAAAVTPGVVSFEAMRAKAMTKDSVVAAKPPSGFVDQAWNAVKNVITDFKNHPELPSDKVSRTLGKGAASLVETAAHGVMALAKTVVTPNKSNTFDESAEHFTENLQLIQQRFNFVNTAPADKTEEAMQNILNILPEGINAAGDTVYEKTGSALFAASSVGALTLLTLSPEIATKTLKRVGQQIRGTKTPTSASAGFDSLAAKNSEAAETLATHVEQVDPNLARYMKRRIQKFIDASEEDLTMLARKHADAMIEEMTPPPIEDLIKGRQVEGLSTGEGKASPHRPARSAPSGYSELGIEPPLPEEARDALGTPLNKEGTTQVERLKRRNKLTPDTVMRDALGRPVIVPKIEVPRDALGTPLNVKGDARKAIRRKVGPMPAAEDRTGLSTGEGKSSPHRPGPSAPSGYSQFGLAPNPEQLAGALRTATKDVTEALTKLDAAGAEVDKSVKEFPKQTVPGSSKDFVDAVTKGKGTSKILDQLTDPKKLFSYMQENAGVAEAWSVDYMRENWKPTLKHSPGYSYPWSVDVLGKLKSFKDEMEARRYMAEEKKVLDAEVKRQAEKRAKQGIPDDQSVTEWNNNKREEGGGGIPPKAKQQPLYLYGGIPITPEMIRSSFKFWSQEIQKIPGVGEATAKVGRFVQASIDNLAPELKGPMAAQAGAKIAQGFAEEAYRQNKFWQDGIQRRVYFQKMGDEASINFLKDSEKGKAFSNPIMEAARQGYAGWAKRIYFQDLATGFTYNPIDHYLPRSFVDSDAVTLFFQRKYGNRWADPRFIKERGFKFLQEALDAGFTLKTNNPEELMQIRQHASDIAEMQVTLLKELEKLGIAKKQKKGDTKAPEGFYPKTRRSPTGDNYWIRDEAVPLMHNAFDSKGLWENPRLAGDVFRGYMGLKNVIVPLKLAGSLFHPMHVIHIDAAAEMTRATKLGAGRPSFANTLNLVQKFLTASAYSPGSWYRSLIDNPRTGMPILKVFQGRRDYNTLSSSDQLAFKDMMEGGLVPTRPREETSNAMQKYRDAVNQGHVTAPFRLPFAFLGSNPITHAIYNVWIPSLKIASYLKDVKVARELNPGWTDNQRQVAFRNTAHKVEARYGEMNYRSLFMNKLIKDAGVGATLSFGWQVGLIDQYVGGTIDLGRAAAERGSLKTKLASGLLDRPIFAMHYIGSALVLGGLMHYWLSGQAPQSFLDYTHPKSGEKDEHGKDIRLNTMWYTREFAGLYKHIQGEGPEAGFSNFVLAKGSGVFEMIGGAVTGLDSLGNQFRGTDDPLYKKVGETLKYELGELEPITAKAMLESDHSAKSNALAVTGFTKAGNYISNSAIENKVSDSFNKFVRPKEKSYNAAEMTKDTKELRRMYKNDDPKYIDKLDSIVGKYDLDPKEIRKMEKQFMKDEDFDISVFQFSRLQWADQKPLLDQMNDEELQRFLPHISKDKQKKYQREVEEAK
jgi:hypothetical protein